MIRPHAPFHRSGHLVPSGTDIPVCHELQGEPQSLSAFESHRTLGSSLPLHPSPDLEGGQPFAPLAKAGLLQPNVTKPFLLIPGFAVLLGHSSPRLSTENLQLATVHSGAPPLVRKGGLVRSNATAPPVSPLGFLFPESRFTSHESRSSSAEAQP